MRSLLDRVILVVGFFPFITLSIPCYSLLACQISVERSAVSLMGTPCILFVAFSLLLLMFFFVFVSLINMFLNNMFQLICLIGMFLFGFTFYGSLSVWTWGAISFPI